MISMTLVIWFHQMLSQQSRTFVRQTKRCLENYAIKRPQRLYVKFLKAPTNGEKHLWKWRGSAPASLTLTASWTLVFHGWRSKPWACRWRQWSKFVDLLSVLTSYDWCTVSPFCPIVFEHQWRPVPKMWRWWKFALLNSYYVRWHSFSTMEVL